MQDYQFRVIEEKQELDKKIESLKSFVKSEKLDSVGLKEAVRLNLQLILMMEYSKVLEDRISNF